MLLIENMVEMTFQLHETQLNPHYKTINITKNESNSTNFMDSFNQTSNLTLLDCKNF